MSEFEMANISSVKYGVVRPTEKGGQPVRVDTYNDMLSARNNLDFWKSQGERAYMVKATWERIDA